MMLLGLRFDGRRRVGRHPVRAVVVPGVGEPPAPCYPIGSRPRGRVGRGGSLVVDVGGRRAAVDIDRPVLKLDIRLTLVAVHDHGLAAGNREDEVAVGTRRRVDSACVVNAYHRRGVALAGLAVGV